MRSLACGLGRSFAATTESSPSLAGERKLYSEIIVKLQTSPHLGNLHLQAADVIEVSPP